MPVVMSEYHSNKKGKGARVRKGEKDMVNTWDIGHFDINGMRFWWTSLSCPLCCFVRFFNTPQDATEDLTREMNSLGYVFEHKPYCSDMIEYFKLSRVLYSNIKSRQVYGY